VLLDTQDHARRIDLPDLALQQVQVLLGCGLLLNARGCVAVIIILHHA
jgi:hypothetical protein